MVYRSLWRVARFACVAVLFGPATLGCTLVIGELPPAIEDSADETPDGGSNGCCDCDGDGVDGEQCGGNDCDDDERNVFPGQQDYFTEPSARVGFNYNCENGDEREYAEVLVCSTSLECDSSKSGFFASLPGEEAPACGESATWGNCGAELGMCIRAHREMKTQGCR